MSERSKSVGIRELKNSVSSYIDRVTAGETITITRRGEPVARMIPTETSPAAETLLADDRVRWRGMKPAVPEAVRPVGSGPSASDYVSEGRR